MHSGKLLHPTDMRGCQTSETEAWVDAQRMRLQHMFLSSMQGLLEMSDGCTAIPLLAHGLWRQRHQRQLPQPEDLMEVSSEPGGRTNTVSPSWKPCTSGTWKRQNSPHLEQQLAALSWSIAGFLLKAAGACQPYKQICLGWSHWKAFQWRPQGRRGARLEPCMRVQWPGRLLCNHPTEGHRLVCAQCRCSGCQGE